MDKAHKYFQSKYYERAIFNITESFKRNRKRKEFNFLKNFPSYTIGMIKNRIFCLNELSFRMDTDISNYLRIRFLRMDVDSSLKFIRPNIYNLSDLDNVSELQSTIPLMQRSLSQGVYLIDNGQILTLYFSYETQEYKNYISEVFFDDGRLALTSTEESVLYCDYKSSEERTIKEKIINLVEYIRGVSSLYQNLHFSESGSETEEMYYFLTFSVRESLVDDNFCSWFKHTLSEMSKNLN
jgi:hypothetical protein